MKNNDKPVAIVDGTNCAARLFFARVPNVAEALVARIQAAARAWDAAAVVVAFDCGPSFRCQIDPNYKAHRPPKPESLVVALDQAAGACAAAGWSVVAAHGFEADDYCASVCHHALAARRRSIIVSADKDVRQCLVDGRVTIAESISLKRGVVTVDWFTAKTLRERHEVTPKQWPDFQALVGDTSDGIKGAVGIGPAIASRLLGTAGDLTTLLDCPWRHAWTVRIRDSLFEFNARAPVVRQLVTLRTDAPMARDVLP